MSNLALQVSGIGKRYRIGKRREAYKTVRDSFASAASNSRQRVLDLFQKKGSAEVNTETDYWALRDVSFDVKHGEVVGLIGRNGAGKSTLLKILSRITEPTEGRARVFGRVGSLLEVGTGFHPELTGRENIFLNGAILGMSKGEIVRKFDEIVAFAEVETFLDTPVKRYSSGMQLRLGFAVAAHLEPEILIVDEVLAVGDAAFQDKCLGKLRDVSMKSGRTVLFVSHNMQAVQSLCTRAVHLEKGSIVNTGSARSVIARYLVRTASTGNRQVWGSDSPGDATFRLRSIAVCSGTEETNVCVSSEDIVVTMIFEAWSTPAGLCVGFDLITSDGIVVLRSYQTDVSEVLRPAIKIGLNSWQCAIPAGLLNAGVYYVCPRVGIHSASWIVNIDGVLSCEVVLDHGVSPFWNTLDGSNRPGIVAPILEWEHSRQVTCSRL